MKKRIHKYLFSCFTALIFVILATMLQTCVREQSIPVQADFSIKVINEDYSVPVKVEITNKTTGADTFQWSFVGASVETSTEKDPMPIVYPKAGVYKISLTASNKDGNSDTKTIEIQADEAMSVDFSWEMQGSSIAPVTLQIQNLSQGATSYHWDFANGMPSTSTEKNPKVTFSSAGEHSIKLTISNGKETYSTEKKVLVKPAMVADFDWFVDFIDEDYQAPVMLFLNNKSSNATTYKWYIEGANPSFSTKVNPKINFPIAGTYNIILEATNDKETKTIEKQILIKENHNLLSFKDIKLGINTAHSHIGAFFSSKLGKVLTKSEVNAENGKWIDFVYFGLNHSFHYNQLVSPDDLQNTTFYPIPNAIHTKIINRQELVGVQLTPSQFDALNNGNDFSNIQILENNTAKNPFNNHLIPRVILFQTEDGRKGAVKIKNYISSENHSYILADIKVQKLP